MTTYNKATLKTFFETGDVPSGTDYANLIDSYVNIVETTTQVMAGALNPTELITARVSAANGNITGILSAATLAVDSISTPSITASAASITGTVSAAGLNVTGNISAVNGLVTASAASFTADVSANGTIYASAMRSVNGFIGGTGIVSAAGTAQATAASLTFMVNRGKGVADGTTTGFTPLANRAGLTQYLFNEGVSANLWPPTGGTINGLPVNAAFSLAASAMVTIVHLTASAYAVK